MSLYDELGVPPDASIDAINAAYRRRAKTEHPHAGGDPEKFAKLSRAIAILRDPQRRAQYDQTGQEDDERSAGPSPAERELVRAFNATLLDAAGRIHFTDIAANTRARLRKAEVAVITQAGEIRGAIECVQDAQGRLKRTTDGRDPLAIFLEDQLADLRRQEKANADHLTVLGEAIQLAKAYEWTADAPPATFDYSPYRQTGIWDVLGSPR